MKVNISLENIYVKYPKKTVLNGISTIFEHSQIHMLIGENGAGKSTLTKVICGDLIPTSGKIFINHKQCYFSNPHDAILNGIVCVHQRPLLADSISVKENLMLGVRSFDKQRTSDLLKSLIPNIKPSTKIKDCGGDTRFFVSLIGALLKNPSVLILDEPSALLNLEQRDFLFTKLKQMANEGMNIIVITHYMQEARNFGDTITYLEDGNIAPPKFLDESKMFGKCDSALKTENTANLSFFNLSIKPANKPSVSDFSFTAKQGEITLISSMVEDGRETLEDLVCGMNNSKANGYVQIKSSNKAFEFKIKNGNFTRRIMEKSPFTFGIIPSDKHFRGSNPNLTILQLLTSKCNFAHTSELVDYAEALIKKADVNITVTDKASMLSGGMLQRLILERELNKDPDILILCEPVHGLDSLSTERLCNRLKNLSQDGKIILVLSSSEFPEDICHTIYRLGKEQ